MNQGPSSYDSRTQKNLTLLLTSKTNLCFYMSLLYILLSVLLLVSGPMLMNHEHTSTRANLSSKEYPAKDPESLC